MSNQIQARVQEQDAAGQQQRLVAATIGGLLGVFLLIGVGFAGQDGFAHNATHDTRHATGFPCH